MLDNGDETKMVLGSNFQATIFISNAFINTYATVFISLCLFLRQRAMVESLGVKGFPARYLHIISVLLQSAAINVPIAITTAVGLWLEIYLGTAMIPVAGASQVC